MKTMSVKDWRTGLLPAMASCVMLFAHVGARGDDETEMTVSGFLVVKNEEGVPPSVDVLSGDDAVEGVPFIRLTGHHDESIWKAPNIAFRTFPVDATNTLENAVLGALYFRGLANEATSNITSSIVVQAEDDFSATSSPSRMEFWTTEVSSTTAAVRLTIRGNGDIEMAGGDVIVGEDGSVEMAGAAIIATTDGKLKIGAAQGTYELEVHGSAWVTGNAWSGSDEHLKENIEPVSGVLHGLVGINPVSFNWRRETTSETMFESGRQIGLLAQEVEAAFPELVTTNNAGVKAVNYDGFSALLVDAIKEVHQVATAGGDAEPTGQAEQDAGDATKALLEAQQEQISAMQRQIDALRKELEAMREAGATFSRLDEASDDAVVVQR